MKVSLVALLTSFVVVICDGKNILKLEESLNCIGEHLKKNLPNSGIHLSDNLFIEELMIDLETISDDFVGHLLIKNLRVYGLSEAVIYIFDENYYSDLSQFDLDLVMEFKKLTFFGEYETEASYNRTSLWGDGYFLSYLKNVSLNGEFEASSFPLDFSTHLPMFMHDCELYIDGLNQKRDGCSEDYDYDVYEEMRPLLKNQNVDASEYLSMKMNEELTKFIKEKVQYNYNIFDETLVPVLRPLIKTFMDSVDSYDQNIIADCFETINYVDDYDLLSR